MQRQNKALTKAQISQQNQKQSLPSIEHIKLTIKIDEQPKPTLIRKLEISPKYDQIPEQINLQSIFSIPKDTIFGNRRASIPTKTINHNKIQQQPQSSLIKKRIQELTYMQNECFYNDNEIFNKVLHQFGLVKHDEPFLDELKMKQFLPNRKISQQKQKWKLKPIISQVRFKNNKQMDFFNIQKVQLLTGKQKKNKSFNVKQIEQSGSQPEIGFATTMKMNEIATKFNQKKQISKTIDNNQNIKKKSKSLNKKVIDLNNMNSLTIKNLESKTFINRQLFRQKISKSLYFKQLDLQNNLQSIPHQQIKQEDTKVQQSQTKAKSLKRFRKKFEPPFQTYYYRNLIWKANYTNEIFVETPQQYQRKIKAFIGKGNNSCMIVGLISRRSWLSITEKAQQANFVWTQLKQLAYFKKQEPSNIQKNKPHTSGHYLPNSIMTNTDQTNFKNYFKTHISSQQHADQRMLPRSKFIKYRTYIKSQEINDKRMQNHLPNNYILGNKKALFNTMSNYYQQIKQDVFNYLPLTFHIKEGLQDPLYFDFLKYYHKKAKQASKLNEDKKSKKIYNAWIVKPGENSNRGNGIKMCLTLDEIKSILKKRQRYPDGSFKTFIVQSYIERPLLYFKRKFDLRHYIMMTCINGIVKGYWYRDGYVRTTSNQYSLKSNSGSIHLTNDAVQKNLPDYGKYQKGNKISYEELNAYIEKNAKIPGKGFYETIYPKMKKIATDSMRASSGGIDPAKLCNNFQVFGMDFMIDANLEVWLIQINTNPCLELSCPLLGCIIPKMVENALQLTMDAMYPPPARFAPKGVHYYKQLQKQNKFELVYDERMQKLYEGSLTVLDKKLMEEQDDTFQDCGENWEDS